MRVIVRPQFCYGMLSRLSKEFGERNVKLRELPDGCLFDITGRNGITGSFKFVDGELWEADLPVVGGEYLSKTQVADFVSSQAPSCLVESLHTHPAFLPTDTYRSDIHLSGCNVDDFIRVAGAYGY